MIVAKQKTKEDGTGAEGGPAPVRVRFLTTWSSDRGYFGPGAEADLPEEVAQSLMDERVVEVL